MIAILVLLGGAVCEGPYYRHVITRPVVTVDNLKMEVSLVDFC